MSAVDIPKTYGSLLLGGLVSSMLSGLVVVQSIVYVKMYPNDTPKEKGAVFVVWLLDGAHTAFVWTALWCYLILDYGVPEKIDVIHWPIALTIVLTAILTFLVHIFFAHRIFKLSEGNYWITAPIVTLAILRLVSASVTTGEMLHYGEYSKFREHIRWIFTCGLALSSAVDILITGSLFLLLKSSRTACPGDESLNVMIDLLIRYAFETGGLTCAGTIISMICWLTMPTNLIFMGLHFVIGKLYANSLLVTLNTRQSIRRARSLGSKDYGVPVHRLDTVRRRQASLSDHFAVGR
ncbi:hypothetical protein CPC08DRAFT_95999 [Agrocybe pediades]|nr:hypothetical protein CPC08DRAFT_95999 [Agrocybe pediades]